MSPVNQPYRGQMDWREAGDKRFQRVNITPLTEELSKNAMTCSFVTKMSPNREEIAIRSVKDTNGARKKITNVPR